MNLNDEAKAVYEAALSSVSPERLVGSNIRLDGDLLKVRNEQYDLAAYERIFLIAFGKAAPGMAVALGALLGDRLTRGLVIAPRGQSGEATGGRPGNLEYLEGSHPLPDGRSVEAALRALALAEQAGEEDLVFVCISGGGSALLCLPADGVTLDEKREVVRGLLRAGADIRELNAVRKHLSAVKGGRLARALFPAEVVNLVISDVIGDDMESIASGPTHWDSSTFGEARDILARRGVWDGAPAGVREHIERGIKGAAEETLKKGDPLFARVRDVVLANNLTALRGARREAERRGYETFILSSSDQGEARKAARDHVAFLSTLACSMSAAPRPLCLLSGGELTVTVKGPGRGGRNTEYVLAALVEIRKSGVEEAFCGACHATGEAVGLAEEERAADWLILSLGTDGIDGPTEAAGAWADAGTLERIHDLGLAADKALEANDSHTFFEKTGNLIVTGPTGTNVMDVRVTLVVPRRNKSA
jgi:glycerate 2-kinase